MPGRFDLKPLLNGLSLGLRKRRVLGREPGDYLPRVALFLVPIAAAGGFIALEWRLPNPDALLSAYALLSGASLMAFTQIASWREKLSGRERRIDDIAKRSLDEAVAHTLAMVLVSALGSALLAIVANVPSGPSAGAGARWVGTVIGSLAFGVGIYLTITLTILVNLLWDSYRRANPSAEVGATDEKRRSA